MSNGLISIDFFNGGENECLLKFELTRVLGLDESGERGWAKDIGVRKCWGRKNLKRYTKIAWAENTMINSLEVRTFMVSAFSRPHELSFCLFSSILYCLPSKVLTLPLPSFHISPHTIVNEERLGAPLIWISCSSLSYVYIQCVDERTTRPERCLCGLPRSTAFINLWFRKKVYTFTATANSRSMVCVSWRIEKRREKNRLDIFE